MGTQEGMVIGIRGRAQALSTWIPTMAEIGDTKMRRDGLVTAGEMRLVNAAVDCYWVMVVE